MPDEFEPHRGDEVDAFIKRERDKYAADLREEDHPREWYALDGLLDDYRLHADVGVPLHVPESEIGPHDA